MEELVTSVAQFSLLFKYYQLTKELEEMLNRLEVPTEVRCFAVLVFRVDS